MMGRPTTLRRKVPGVLLASVALLALAACSAVPPGQAGSLDASTYGPVLTPQKTNNSDLQ